jgi:1,4-dihydroxy-2-naphthoate octaprenyltransferase
VTIAAVVTSVFPIFCLVILGTIPMVIKSGRKLKHVYNELNKIVPVMSSTLVFSRLTGVLLVFGFIINIG